jgi:hypothetical protein
MGVSRPLSTLDRPIRALLRRGYDGGFIVIKRYRKTPFVQLRKYIRCPGDYGIELSFPMVDWSMRYVPAVEQLCDAQNLGHTKESHRGAMPFLYVDFGHDVENAHSFVVRVLTDVFGWSEDTKCFALLEHGDPRDVLIDRMEL